MALSRTCFVVGCILALLALLAPLAPRASAGHRPTGSAHIERLRAAKRAGDVAAAVAIDPGLMNESAGTALPASQVERVVRTELLQRGGGWRADVLVSDPSRASASPAMAIQSDGTLYVVVEEQTSNYLDIYKSPDGGFMWTYEFSLVTAQDPTRPAIAIGEGVHDRLLIVYEYGRGTNSSAIHAYWEDLDGGGSAAVLIEANPLGVANPQICVDNPEYDYWYAYVTYVRARLVDQPDASDLRFSRTVNFGDGWTAPATLAQDIAELDRPDIDYGGDNLYVTFTRLYAPGDRDVHVRRSTDLGSNWDSELLIGGSAADEYHPRVAATNGDDAVAVAYTRLRSAQNTDIECYASTNAGASWSYALMPYTAAAEDLVDLTVSESFGRIHAAFWRDFNIVYTWADCAAPQAWADAEIINEDRAAVPGQRPAIAANPWKPVEPCVAWSDFRVSGYWRIYFDAAYPLGDFAVIASIDLAEEVLVLLNWKSLIGYDAYQVVLEWIYGTYPGADDAEKIWNYLADHYQEISHVLLIGDVDELPMRRLYPDGNPGGLLGYGTDYYYAKLDVADWDQDDDGRWGEFLEDGFDPVPDLLVGRIPFNDEAVVQTICFNITSFESSSGPWRRKALLAHGLMDMQTDGGDLGELLRQDFLGPWSVETLYEKGGLAPSIHPCTAPLSTESYRSRCTLERQALVSCVAHGHPGGMSGQRWIDDHIPNERPDYKLGEVGYTEFSRAGDIPAHPVSAVVFLNGCSTAPIFGPDSLADASPLRSRYLIRTPRSGTMLKNYLRYGAPAVIGSTAGSEYKERWASPTDGGGQSLSYYFYDDLLDDHMQVGQAFYDAMLHHAAMHGLDRGIRVFNYYGDPSLSLDVPEYLAGAMDKPLATGPTVRPAGWRSAIAAGRDRADSAPPPAAPLIDQPPTWAETAAMDAAITVNHVIEPAPGSILAAVMTHIDTITTRGQVMRSTDSGASWESLGTLTGCRAITAIGQAEPQALLAAGWADLGDSRPGVIYRSGDQGETWEIVFTIPEGIVTALVAVGPGEWLAAAYGRPEANLGGFILRTMDSGSSWQPWGELGEDMYPHSLARGGSGLVFAGVSFDEGQAGSILRSDNGIEWLPMSGLEPDVRSVYALLPTPEWLYAAVEESDAGFVYVTEPLGTVWTKTTEFPDPDVRAVESLARDRWGKVYAGVEVDRGGSATRVYRMTPGPAGFGDWEAYGGAIDAAEAVHALAATSACIVAGTAFNGVPGFGRVLRCALEGVVGVGDQGAAPAPGFELGQNIPNPFNPRTLIRYTLPAPGGVRIDIYDTMGRRVRALVHSDSESAGPHTAIWDGTDDRGRAVASGVYFYRLDAGAASEVRQMVLIR